jgi:hypothetical protein
VRSSVSTPDPFASTQDPDEDEDGVPQVTELLRLDVELLPLRGETPYVALNRRDAAKRFPTQIREVRPPLDIRMPDFCDGVEVTRIEGLVGPADGLDVSWDIGCQVCRRM